MVTKILVVDDEPDLETLVAQKFRRKIRKGKMDFIFASNGEDALSKIEKNQDIDIVLGDINMPVMDGLTLLRRLQELDNCSDPPIFWFVYLNRVWRLLSELVPCRCAHKTCLHGYAVLKIPDEDLGAL